MGGSIREEGKSIYTEIELSLSSISTIPQLHFGIFIASNNKANCSQMEVV